MLSLTAWRGRGRSPPDQGGTEGGDGGDDERALTGGDGERDEGL